MDVPPLSPRDRAAAITALQAQIAEGKRIDHSLIPSRTAFRATCARYDAWHQQNRIVLADLSVEGRAIAWYERVPSTIVMQNWTLSDPLGAATAALRTEVHARVQNLEALLAALTLAPPDTPPHEHA